MTLKQLEQLLINSNLNYAELFIELDRSYDDFQGFSLQTTFLDLPDWMGNKKITIIKELKLINSKFQFFIKITNKTDENNNSITIGEFYRLLNKVFGKDKNDLRLYGDENHNKRIDASTLQKYESEKIQTIYYGRVGVSYIEDRLYVNSVE